MCVLLTRIFQSNGFEVVRWQKIAETWCFRSAWRHTRISSEEEHGATDPWALWALWKRELKNYRRRFGMCVLLTRVFQSNAFEVARWHKIAETWCTRAVLRHTWISSEEEDGAIDLRVLWALWKRELKNCRQYLVCVCRLYGFFNSMVLRVLDGRKPPRLGVPGPFWDTREYLRRKSTAHSFSGPYEHVERENWRITVSRELNWPNSARPTRTRIQKNPTKLPEILSIS